MLFRLQNAPKRDLTCSNARSRRELSGSSLKTENDLSTSSYGHFIPKIETWSQCCVLFFMLCAIYVLVSSKSKHR